MGQFVFQSPRWSVAYEKAQTMGPLVFQSPRGPAAYIKAQTIEPIFFLFSFPSPLLPFLLLFPVVVEAFAQRL